MATLGCSQSRAAETRSRLPADVDGIVKSSKSSSTEAAQYIANMARELRILAVNSELGFVAYLLSMVEQEAETEGGGPPPRGRRPGRA